MSLSRSPSPQRAGGWSSPGLSSNFATHSRATTPVKSYSVNGSHNVTWASAQAKSAQINGYPASAKDRGLTFFGKHMRNLSASLPFFHRAPQDERFAEKEKLGRGRWQPQGNGGLSAIPGRFARGLRRVRLRSILLLAVLFFTMFFYATRK